MVFLGLESTDQYELKAMDKKLNQKRSCSRLNPVYVNQNQVVKYRCINSRGMLIEVKAGIFSSGFKSVLYKNSLYSK